MHKGHAIFANSFVKTLGSRRLLHWRGFSELELRTQSFSKYLKNEVLQEPTLTGAQELRTFQRLLYKARLEPGANGLGCEGRVYAVRGTAQRDWGASIPCLQPCWSVRGI